MLTMIGLLNHSPDFVERGIHSDKGFFILCVGIHQLYVLDIIIHTILPEILAPLKAIELTCSNQEVCSAVKGCLYVE